MMEYKSNVDSVTLSDMKKRYNEIVGELTQLEREEYARKRRIKELTEQRDALNAAAALLFPEEEEEEEVEP